MAREAAGCFRIDCFPVVNATAGVLPSPVDLSAVISAYKTDRSVLLQEAFYRSATVSIASTT